MPPFEPKGIFPVLDPEHGDADGSDDDSIFKQLEMLWPSISIDQQLNILNIVQACAGGAQPPDTDPLGLEWRTPQ